MRRGLCLLLAALPQCYSAQGPLSWPNVDLERVFLLNASPPQVQVLYGPFEVSGGRATLPAEPLAVPSDASVALVGWNPSEERQPHPAVETESVVPVKNDRCTETGSFLVESETIRYTGPIGDGAEVFVFDPSRNAFDLPDSPEVRKEIALTGNVDPIECTEDERFERFGRKIEYPPQEDGSRFDSAYVVVLDDSRALVASPQSLHLVDQGGLVGTIHNSQLQQAHPPDPGLEEFHWHIVNVIALSTSSSVTEVLIHTQGSAGDMFLEGNSLFRASLSPGQSTVSFSSSLDFEVRQLIKDPNGGIVGVGSSSADNFDVLFVSSDGGASFEAYPFNEARRERFWTINPTGLPQPTHIVGTRNTGVYAGNALEGRLSQFAELPAGVDGMSTFVEEGELIISATLANGTVWERRSPIDDFEGGEWQQRRLFLIPDREVCLNRLEPCELAELRNNSMGDVRPWIRSSRGRGVVFGIYGCDAPFVLFPDGCTAPIQLDDQEITGGEERRLLRFGVGPPNMVVTYTTDGAIYFRALN